MQQQKLTQKPTAKNSKKIIMKCVISCLLLAYLLYKADLHTIWDAFTTANPFWLVIAFSFHIVGFLLTAYRWQLLLGARDAHFSIGGLIQSYYYRRVF